MTTLKPEQKDILEKLNEIALEANWGTVERVNGVPKAIAVIQEAMEEIKRLRELPKEILKKLDGMRPTIWRSDLKELAEKYGVTLDEKN